MATVLAIGPKTQRASWSWLGEDTAEELRRYFDVTTYALSEVPVADVIVAIKHPPSSQLLESAKRRRSRVIYLPVDRFYSTSQIEGEATVLRQCDLILLHTPSLTPFFSKFAPTRFIDHHGKYFLSRLAPYKERGYAIWIGAFEHLPYLIRYVHDNPIPLNLRILSNIDNRQSRRRGIEVARTLGLKLRMRDDKINGMRIERWTQELQTSAMLDAKAAIDIKGDSFNQIHKPPTKAQQFICSGIPLAMTKGAATEYFAKYGLDMPEPGEIRWLSRGYYDQICAIADFLRSELSLETIGKRYKAIIEQTLAQ